MPSQVNLDVCGDKNHKDIRELLMTCEFQRYPNIARTATRVVTTQQKKVNY